MSPGDCTDTLRSFLEASIRIDQWGLNFPEQVEDDASPPSIAREDPANEFETEGYFPGQGSPSPFTVAQTDKFLITFRVSGQYTYEQIQSVRREAQNRVVEVLGKLRMDPRCIHEDMSEIQPTGSVMVAQETNKDWLIGLQFKISSVFECEAHELEPVTNFLGAT